MIWAKWIEERRTREETELLVKVSELLWKACKEQADNNKKPDVIFECHSICRALWLKFGKDKFKVVSGNFIGFSFESDGRVGIHRCSHSWLVTENGNILDPYPVGRISMGPIFVACAEGPYKPFCSGQYQPDIAALEELCIHDVWRRARILCRLFH